MISDGQLNPAPAVDGAPKGRMKINESEYAAEGFSAIGVEDVVPVTTASTPFELWATIKKSSKYYRTQGIDSNGKVIPFPIFRVTMTDADSYDFKGGAGGAYRREDLVLWVKCGDKLKRI